MTIIKSHEKESQDYYLSICCQNVSFEETDTEFSTGKNDFDYCEKYIRVYQTPMTVLKKQILIQSIFSD